MKTVDPSTIELPYFSFQAQLGMTSWHGRSLSCVNNLRLDIVRDVSSDSLLFSLLSASIE
jgi:hypothetical protein